MINLDKIIQDVESEVSSESYTYYEKYDFEKRCMKEAIRRTLELVCEKIDKDVNEAWDDFDDGFQYGIRKSKERIMSVIKEIE